MLIISELDLMAFLRPGFHRLGHTYVQYLLILTQVRSHQGINWILLEMDNKLSAISVMVNKRSFLCHRYLPDNKIRLIY